MQTQPSSKPRKVQKKLKLVEDLPPPPVPVEVGVGEPESKSKIVEDQDPTLPTEKIDNLDNLDLLHDYEVSKCEPSGNEYSKKCNKFLLKKEMIEREELAQHPEENEFLYPSLNDPNFIIKIAEKKEFNDNRYDGEIHEIKDRAKLLANAEFELAPQQVFVRNFLSFQTPYNSLLLYHGLGSGKCHAKGTPIMMSDGNIKRIEDIEVGDLLMGDDSKPRKVLLARGEDKMYDVIPVKGENIPLTKNIFYVYVFQDFQKYVIIIIKQIIILTFNGLKITHFNQKHFHTIR